ncbi:MAG: hypothetical protein H7101_05280, partial [Deinococcales bacterium]|nr:hypothetical protein [Chitinophagaceae bacterium]
LPLHQHIIATKQQIAVFFIFIDKTLPQKGLVEKKMPIIINKLIQTINETIVTTA